MDGKLKLPFVQKTRGEGYDGKGVAVIKTEADFSKILKGPSLVEELVDIEKELAVIVAKNEDGEIASYPTVEMEFNPIANLVEFLLCPAQITPEQEKVCVDLARSVIENTREGKPSPNACIALACAMSCLKPVVLAFAKLLAFTDKASIFCLAPLIAT